MILMWENPFPGSLEAVGPEMETSEASAIWAPKKSWFLGPTPSNGLSNGFARVKIIKSKRHINKQVHW